jgi:hypothetical protein
MLIKAGEIIVEKTTGREYVIEEIAEPNEHITERWIGFRNLRTRKLYTADEPQLRRDFEPKVSQ